jgi:hypothetical protein
MAKAKDTLARSSKVRQGTAATGSCSAPSSQWHRHVLLLHRSGGEESVADPFKVLAEENPPDKVLELYNRFTPNLKDISTVPLGKILDMGGSGGVGL